MSIRTISYIMTLRDQNGNSISNSASFRIISIHWIFHIIINCSCMINMESVIRYKTWAKKNKMNWKRRFMRRQKNRDALLHPAFLCPIYVQFYWKTNNFEYILTFKLPYFKGFLNGNVYMVELTGLEPVTSTLPA